MNSTKAQPAESSRSGTARSWRVLLAVLPLAGMLGGCAIPPALAVASYLGDGVLMAATGKDSTDMGLSLATGRDCATFRMFKQEDICRDNVEAQPEAIPVEVAQDEAAQRHLVASMPADEASRSALSGRALTVAFQPLAGAVPVSQAGGTDAPVLVAALPRPASPTVVLASLTPAVGVANSHRAHHAAPVAVAVDAPEKTLIRPATPLGVALAEAPRPAPALAATTPSEPAVLFFP